MGIINEFKKFALRGSIVDLAVGFTVGAAFSTIARSLVDDIIMPPVGLLLGNKDFAQLFYLLKPGEKKGPPYLSLQEALDSGAVTLNYGRFVNNILIFLLVAFAMFLIIRLVNLLEARLEHRLGHAGPPKEPGEPDCKKCPYCLSTIPFKATRCSHCTSMLDEVQA